MPKLIDLSSLENAWRDVPEGEVRSIPLFERDDVRVRILVTRKAGSPRHVHSYPEAYFVLHGEVIYETDKEVRVRKGEGIVFSPGELHAGRVETGAVSINVDFKETGRKSS